MSTAVMCSVTFPYTIDMFWNMLHIGFQIRVFLRWIYAWTFHIPRIPFFSLLKKSCSTSLLKVLIWIKWFPGFYLWGHEMKIVSLWTFFVTQTDVLMLLDNNFFYSFLLVGVSLKKKSWSIVVLWFFCFYSWLSSTTLFFFSEEVMFHSLLHCWPFLFVLCCQVSYYV